MIEHKADIGVIGLAVMGRNLVLNLIDHGLALLSTTGRQNGPGTSQHREKAAPV